jgi:hypothetical protein
MTQFSIKRLFVSTGLIAVGCWLITLIRLDPRGPSTEIITLAIILTPAAFCAGFSTLFKKTGEGAAFGLIGLLVLLMLAMFVGFFFFI